MRRLRTIHGTIRPAPLMVATLLAFGAPDPTLVLADPAETAAGPHVGAEEHAAPSPGGDRPRREQDRRRPPDRDRADDPRGRRNASVSRSTPSEGATERDDLAPLEAGSDPVLTLSRTVVGDPGEVADRVSRDRSRRWRYDVSERGLHLGYVARRGSRMAVVVDGKAGPEFDRILDTPLPRLTSDPEQLGLRAGAPTAAVLFSPDGRHHAYTARRDGSWHIVVDGVLGPALAEGGDSLGVGGPSGLAGAGRRSPASDVQFAGEDGRLAYYGRLERPEDPDKPIAIVDAGRIVATHGAVSHLLLSPDGRRMAYFAKDGAGRDAATMLVIDGESFGPFDIARRSAFLADGRHFAVVGLPEGGERVLIDGRPSGPRLADENIRIATDPTGRLGFIARAEAEDEDQVVVVVEGEIEHRAEFRGPVSLRSLALSPDGTRHAVVLTDEGRAHVVVDDERSLDYDGIESVEFSADGGSVAFIASNDRVRYLVVDGRESEGMRNVADFAFAPRGGRWACTGRSIEGEDLFIVDGTPIELPERSEVTSFGFGPEGRHLAYAVSRGSTTSILLDGDVVQDRARHLRILSREDRTIGNRKVTEIEHFALGRGGGPLVYPTFEGFVIDGEVVTDGEIHDPIVSQDAMHFAGWSGGAGAEAHLVVDGRRSESEFPRPDKLGTRRLEFDDDGNVVALVETESGFERIIVRP